MNNDNPGSINPNVWLAEYAKVLGVPKKELLVLAPNNDPFNAGTTAHVEQAKWFAGVYEAVGYKGIHLRRLHYRAYDAGVATITGEEYPNTEKQWDALQAASKYARYLGLVDPEDFIDNRSPTPHLSVNGLLYAPEPSYHAEPREGFSWVLPRIRSDLTGYANPGADWEVEGYYYGDELQPLLVEVWTEKSGDDATLIPLARGLGINYCPGVGFQSITNIRRLFNRVRSTEKPGRILYISDFDPAGMGMPVQVGRQTQFSFWQLKDLAKTEAPNVKVEPIALTHDQVIGWELPRKPLKAGYEHWEDRFGEGAVEVDALEARQPGQLRHLVSARVAELQDPDLDGRIHEAREDAENRVRYAIQEVVDEYSEVAQEIVGEYEEVASRYRDRLEALSDEFEEALGDIRERFDALQNRFGEAVRSLEVELPGLPEPEPPDEHHDWLYDSDRDFLGQTQEFRRRQRKN